MIYRIIRCLSISPALWLAKRRAVYFGQHARTLRSLFESSKGMHLSHAEMLILSERVRKAEMLHRVSLRSLDGYDKEYSLHTVTEQDKKVVLSILLLAAFLVFVAAGCRLYVEHTDERTRREKVSNVGLSEDLGTLRVRAAEAR